MNKSNTQIESLYDSVVEAFSIFSLDVKLRKDGVLVISVDNLKTYLPHTVWSDINLDGYMVKGAVKDELAERFSRIHTDASPFKKSFSGDKFDKVFDDVFGLRIKKSVAKGLSRSKSLQKLIDKEHEQERVAKFVGEDK